MDSKELRLGNYIDSHYQGETVVTSIEKNGAKTCTTTEIDMKIGVIHEHIFTSNEMLCGIIVSEEWLKKFGFKKCKLQDPSGKFYDWELYDDFHNPFILRHWLSDGNCHVVYGGRRIGWYYVHQLQNLYFALTGTELKLKK